MRARYVCVCVVRVPACVSLFVYVRSSVIIRFVLNASQHNYSSKVQLGLSIRAGAGHARVRSTPREFRFLSAFLPWDKSVLPRGESANPLVPPASLCMTRYIYFTPEYFEAYSCHCCIEYFEPGSIILYTGIRRAVSFSKNVSVARHKCPQSDAYTGTK